MFKVGDKVRVIEKNLSKECIDEYQTVKEFIGENKEFFSVVKIWEDDYCSVEISKQNGRKLSFSKYELEKVEE